MTSSSKLVLLANRNSRNQQILLSTKHIPLATPVFCCPFDKDTAFPHSPSWYSWVFVPVSEVTTGRPPGRNQALIEGVSEFTISNHEYGIVMLCKGLWTIYHGGTQEYSNQINPGYQHTSQWAVALLIPRTWHVYSNSTSGRTGFVWTCGLRFNINQCRRGSSLSEGRLVWPVAGSKVLPSLFKNHPVSSVGHLKSPADAWFTAGFKHSLADKKAASTKYWAFETKAASAAQPCHLLLRHDLKRNVSIWFAHASPCKDP